MALISFRCTSCNQGLKVGADKAGRKIKCTKCGTVLIVPSSDSEEAKTAGASAAAARSTTPGLAPEEPKKKVVEEEENDMKGYGLLMEPEAEEQQAPDKAKKDQQKAEPLKRKLKTLPDLDLWEKVKTGLQIMMVGTFAWGGAVLFMTLLVILGIINGPEYSEVLENVMTVKTTPAGEVMVPNMPAFMIGLVSGTGYEGIGKTFYILSAVLALLQLIIWMAGYGVCLAIPDRYGTRGQLKALLALGGLNFLAILILKLLPAIGSINYILVPYAIPEVSLIDANMGRDPTIWVHWAEAPFWEMLLNVALLGLFYAQPVLIGVFIWSIGMTLREDPLIHLGHGAVTITFGIAFGLLAFHLLTMTGTSGVALVVLRVTYGLWLGFTILLLVRLPMAIQSTRAILQKYLDGAELKDDDDEDDKKPKRKRKARRDDDDEDDD
jgi:predicted RNA-binding Zn-ribbon protein involved in translation (DUF1610 family)